MVLTQKYQSINSHIRDQTYVFFTMVKNQGDSHNDTTTARLVDSLKCDVSVKESMLKHASTIVDCEKKKLTVVAKDSKSVLNSLLEDIREVRWLVESWLTFVS